MRRMIIRPILFSPHARSSPTDQPRIGLAIFRSGNHLCYSFVTKPLFIKSFYISTVEIWGNVTVVSVSTEYLLNCFKQYNCCAVTVDDSYEEGDVTYVMLCYL